MSYGVFRHRPPHHLYARRPWVPTNAGATTYQVSLDDSVVLAEQILKEVQLRRAETVSLSEAFTKMAQIVRGDAASFTEGFSAVIVRVVALGDSLGLSENSFKQVNKSLGETVALTEARLLQVARRFSESIGWGESLTTTKIIPAAGADTVVFTENLGTSVTPGGGASVSGGDFYIMARRRGRR